MKQPTRARVLLRIGLLTAPPEGNSMSLFTKAFITDASERAVKTLAQTVLAAVGLDAANVLAADWGQILSLGAGATIISVLTSIVSAPRDDTLSPASAVKAAGLHELPA